MDFEEYKSDLQSRVDRGLKYAKDKSDGVEIFMVKTKSTNINIFQGLVQAIEGGSIGVGVRVLKDGKLGFASSSGITDDAVNHAINSAADLAGGLLEKDENFKGFVSTASQAPDMPIGEDVISQTSEEAVTIVSAIISEAMGMDDRIKSVFGSYTSGYGAYVVGNSEGINKATINGGNGAGLFLQGSDGGPPKTGGDFQVDRSLIKGEDLAKNAVERTIRLFGSGKLGKSEKMPVIFENTTAGGFLRQGLANSISAKSVYEKRTQWADRLGDNVGTKDLSIYDNGLSEHSPGTAGFDHEGTERRSVSLIDKGVLKTFTYDQYHANIFEVPTTGNGVRNGQQNYENIPGISMVNLTIYNGSKSIEDIAADAGDGIMLTGQLMGLIHSNTITGEFSVVCNSPFLVEGGEIKGAVDPVTVAGNFYEMYGAVRSIANDQKMAGNNTVPSIAFDGFTVSG